MSPSGQSGSPPGLGDLQRYNTTTAQLEPPFAVVNLAYRGEGQAFG